MGIDANAQKTVPHYASAPTPICWPRAGRFIPDGSYYRISVLHTQKGIQVANSSTADNTLLEQWTYWGGSHQQWRIVRNAEGYATIINRKSDKAMTVRDASLSDGALISQMPSESGPEPAMGHRGA